MHRKELLLTVLLVDQTHLVSLPIYLPHFLHLLLLARTSSSLDDDRCLVLL